MTVLIIGAGGYLGLRLKQYYEAKEETVTTFSFRPTGDGDDRARVTVELANRIGGRPRAVIVAGACQSGRDDPASLDDLVMSNVWMPAAVASLILAHSPETALITFGSHWQVPQPFNAYAASKSAVEPFLDHFAQSGLKCATLRLSDVYGPADPRRKIVNLIARALVTGDDLPMSPGGQVIDLVHVDDVVRAVDSVRISDGEHTVWNIRSGAPITIAMLVNRMRALAEKPGGNIRMGALAYRPRERFEISGVDGMPGWRPQVALDDGLRQIIAEQQGKLAQVESAS